MRRAGGLVRQYGALAVNVVALAVEAWELEGVDWADGLEVPGAWLHSEIRRLEVDIGYRATTLGYSCALGSGDWVMVVEDSSTKYLAEYRRRQGRYPWEPETLNEMED